MRLPLLLQLLHPERDVLLELELLLLVPNPLGILDVVLCVVEDLYHLVDVGLLIDLAEVLVQMLLVVEFFPIRHLGELDGVGVLIESLALGLLSSEAFGLVTEGVSGKLRVLEQLEGGVLLALNDEQRIHDGSCIPRPVVFSLMQSRLDQASLEFP